MSIQAVSTSNELGFYYLPIRPQTINFALIIIFGVLNVIAVGGVGLSGMFGALGLSKVHSIVILSLGGGIGLALTIIGITGLTFSIKDCSEDPHGISSFNKNSSKQATRRQVAQKAINKYEAKTQAQKKQAAAPLDENKIHDMFKSII